MVVASSNLWENYHRTEKNTQSKGKSIIQTSILGFNMLIFQGVAHTNMIFVWPRADVQVHSKVISGIAEVSRKQQGGAQAEVGGLQQCIRNVHPKKINGWNPNMENLEDDFPLSIGWFCWFQPFIFQGVSHRIPYNRYTLQVTDTSPTKALLSRWFSSSIGGIC